MEETMKKLILVLALLALFAAGCNGLNETFVRAVDSNWKNFEPQYRKYTENDPNLPEDSKKRRLSAIDDFTKMVAEYKAELDKED
jgi:hypothetical protein